MTDLRMRDWCINCTQATVRPKPGRAAMPRHQRDGGFVYVIRNQSGTSVKIGFSNDPIRRLRELQAGTTGKLRLLMTFEGTMEDERALHQDFAPWRRRNEWFRLTGKVEDFVVDTIGYFQASGWNDEV